MPTLLAASIADPLWSVFPTLSKIQAEAGLDHLQRSSCQEDANNYVTISTPQCCAYGKEKSSRPEKGFRSKQAWSGATFRSTTLQTAENWCPKSPKHFRQKASSCRYAFFSGPIIRIRPGERIVPPVKCHCKNFSERPSIPAGINSLS
jgi:hypothetical protein